MVLVKTYKLASKRSIVELDGEQESRADAGVEKRQGVVSEVKDEVPER